MKKCLYCLEALPEPASKDGDFHSHCSHKFFGTASEPQLDYGLKDMEALAAQVVRAHMAVTGVQAKISLHLDKPETRGKPARLTLVGLWGQFILKPPTAAYPAMPEVEHATMHLASLFKIPTVSHSLIRLKSGELAYITRRIDRPVNGKWAMEDMCQLTGRLTEDKYKGSLEQVGKTLRQLSTQPGLDAVRFFELALFCFLTGNADMHLKNFSMWRPGKHEIQFSPAYDLVATKLLLPQDKEESALTLDGKKKNLRRKNFDSLALSLEIGEKVRDAIYAGFTDKRDMALAALEMTLLSGKLKQDYGALLTQRYQRLGLA